MTDTKTILKRAAWIDNAVVREYERACFLAKKEFYTEASLRLGRTIEAALYAIGRELGLDLHNRIIKHINKLRDSLDQKQKEIIRKRHRDEVRALSNISKQLSEAIAYLAEDQNLMSGELEEEPQRNEQLLRRLIQQVDDPNQQRGLKASESLLREIQIYRNQAAHAALEGTEREVDKDEYDKLFTEVSKFINLLANFILGYRAKNLWSENPKNIPEHEELEPETDKE